MQTHDLFSVPDNLPVPEDDGGCDHLTGAFIPPIQLTSTNGSMVDLTQQGRPWAVVYCYPRTGRPDSEIPGGLEAWNSIPGARGCTPQSCAYRDRYSQLYALGADVFGLSTQDPEYQLEAAQRLHLPFPLLSDEQLELARALRLPTFEFANSVLIKRLALIIRSGRIEKVIYPIFPSNSDAAQVVEWIARHAPPTASSS